MPTIDFNDIDELIAYVDQYIVENHNNEITGEAHNNVENGLAKFIREAPRNSGKATLINTSGFYTANPSDSILIFTPQGLGSVELVDNRWNEWTIINQTSNSKQLTGTIANYTRVTGTLSNIIPPQSSLTLIQGKNNKWYEASNRYGGSVGNGDVFDRIEFTIGADVSPILMVPGQTVLEIPQLGIKNDSFYIELIGSGELPRTLTDQIAYDVDYYETDEEKVIVTFNSPAQLGQTYIIHYTYNV